MFWLARESTGGRSCQLGVSVSGSEVGYFARWRFRSGRRSEALLRCAVTHLDGKGDAKVVKRLKYPLTGGPRQVDQIITDLAVFDVVGPKGSKEGLVLREMAPKWTVEELQAVTEADFTVPPQLQQYSL
jgi:acyl CoA:acetate/3-ketoacid CoA transferase beta subunit